MRIHSKSGSFATAIQLALLPLAAERLLRTMYISMLQREVPQESAHQKRHISAGDQITCRITKHLDHQHLGEINQSVNQLQADYTNELIFCTEQRGFCKRNFCNFYIQSRKV
jgi:N-acetyl-gamma-glutamyl-phosphate reductase